MKRLAIVTISLLSAALSAGATAAYAAESSTIYPEDAEFIKTLEFSTLADYAVDGEKYAFAEGKTVSLYENGNLTPVTLDGNVTALDCKDGVFYCSTADKTYSLPELTEAEHVFPSYGGDLIVENYIYYYDDDGALTVYNKSTKDSKTFEVGYTLLKQYGNKVYAAKDNYVYEFTGEQSELITLEYADYAATDSLAVGQTSAALKDYALKFVTVESGSFMTAVDLTSLDEQFFVTGETVRAGENTVALLLCYTGGNAAIIAIGDKSYILLKSKTAETQIKCDTSPEFSNATIIGNRIYASPYVITGTAAVSNAAGTIVKVNKKLELETVLGSAFYEVEYTDGNDKKIGYVADGFLTEFIIEDNKEPDVIPDPEYSEKNDTKTVLLILAVVVLVLTAVGYLAYVGTADKNKKKVKKEKHGKTTDNDNI